MGRGLTSSDAIARQVAVLGGCPLIGHGVPSYPPTLQIPHILGRLALVTVLLVALVVPATGAQRIKLSASLADLEKAARKDSNDAASHYNVALAYWNARRWDDVDSSLHRAVRIDPRFGAAFVALSFLPYARRGSLADEEREDRVPGEWRPMLEESDRMYRQAFMIDPLVELRLGDAVFPRSTAFLETLEALFGEWLADYRDGLDQYYLGKYQEAYDRFQRVFFAINGDRHSERLWNTLFYWHGLAAAQVGKHDEAVSDFQTILDRYRDAETRRRDSTLHVPLRTNEFRYILGVLQQRAGRFCSTSGERWRGPTSGSTPSGRSRTPRPETRETRDRTTCSASWRSMPGNVSMDCAER